MGRQLLIRCNAGLPLREAVEKVEQLLNVKCELRNTGFGESHMFSSMGLDGAIYDAPIESHVVDRRLEDHDVVVDIGLYARPVGKAYDEFDVLYNIAFFIAGIIARHLKWSCYVCSEESNVVGEVSCLNHNDIG